MQTKHTLNFLTSVHTKDINTEQLLSEINFESILDLTTSLTSDYDESHNVRHHIDVYKNAFNIFLDVLATEEKYSNDDTKTLFCLITYASLLHDVIDHKYPSNIILKTTQLNDYLDKNSAPNSNDIKWIINNISYSKEVKSGYPVHANKLVQLARNIVSDADKLEALDEIGIRRCTQFTTASNPIATPSDIQRLVIIHCYDKLLKLKDHFIRTAAGKRMAEHGHAIIQEFVDKICAGKIDVS